MVAQSYFLIGLVTVLLLTGCIQEPQIAGVSYHPSGEVVSIQVQDDHLVIRGSHLDEISEARLSGENISQKLHIADKSASYLKLMGSTPASLHAGGALNLILSDAVGDSVYPIVALDSAPRSITTDKLADKSVTVEKLDSMGAGHGQILKWDEGSDLWQPSDLSALTYAGMWDASTATEPSAAAVAGDFYLVNVGADDVDLADGNGLRDYGVGDWLIRNDAGSWDHMSNSSLVVSFNGRQGDVVATTNDYTWAQIDKTTSSIGNIADVDLTGTDDGMVLQYNSAEGKWAAIAINDPQNAFDSFPVNTLRASGSGGLQLTDDSGNGMTIADGGYVGFGTSTPAGTLDVGPAGNTLCINGVCRTSWPTGSGSGAFTDSGTDAFYNGGDVGIGTATPSAKLEVDGNITASGTITAAELTTSGTITAAELTASGTITASSDVKVGSNSLCQSDGTNCPSIDNLGTGRVDNNELNDLDGVTSNIQMQLTDLNDNKLDVVDQRWSSATGGINYAGGKVGIGVDIPTVKLQVDGSIKATSFIYTSDQRLKRNIASLPDALEKILEMRGVSFNWENSGEPEIGLIAQEVEEVYPDLVITDPNSGLKAVKYGNLVAPLIEAIKEQQRMIKQLQERIEHLEQNRSQKN